MLHDCPVPQAFPHSPQCPAFRFKSAHVPLQSVWPVGQLHWLIRQMRPGPQAMLQAPQFDESPVVSMQRPPQAD
jgi:hypothetical protein